MSAKLILIFLLFLTNSFKVTSRTLTDLVCRINPRKCEDFRSISSRSHQVKEKHNSEQTVSMIGAPSLSEFQRWNNYEETAQGTGFLKPETGFNQIPYGPGLGDIGITTGVGVQHPFGGIGIERDFGISMGGNGRIGGIPVGWGNGGVRSVGSAPWANP